MYDRKPDFIRAKFFYLQERSKKIYASINSLLTEAYEELKTWKKEDLPVAVELS